MSVRKLGYSSTRRSSFQCLSPYGAGTPVGSADSGARLATSRSDPPEKAASCRSPGQHGARNHETGYNAVFFDGHAKLITWGQRANTLPDTRWPCG